MFGKIFITQLRNCVMLVTPLHILMSVTRVASNNRHKPPNIATNYPERLTV